MEEVRESAAIIPKSNRRILIVGGPKGEVETSLYPHEVLRSKNLEVSLEAISGSRPDLVIYFSHGKEDRLEEHVMTWLIEGFRGKFIVFDPANRIKDFEILLESQVIDEYLSGPVSPTRFLSIVKSHLTRDVRFASPRAMTTFDLFRNLFDRGLNAIFFLGEDLERCVAANLRAEQMTGRTLYELRQIGLHDLVYPDQFDRTLKIIRRANRHYYDAKGITVLRDRLDRRREVAFSCGVFNFGRKNFVKIEIQDIAESAGKMKALQPQPTVSTEPTYDPVTKVLNQESFLRALNHNLSLGGRKNASLSLILCKIKPGEASTGHEEASEEETNLLQSVAKILQDNIRQTDIVARLSHYQFAILMPKTVEEKANKSIVRLKASLESLPAFRNRLYEFEVGFANCPPDAYPFMRLLRSAENL